VVDLECIPYAVGHAKEGISLLVRMGPYRVLLDCGLTPLDPLLQSLHTPNQSPTVVAASPLALPADLVLCSHAHPDHARGLLALHRTFPTLPMYASEVTTHLLPLNWPQEKESIPLFCQGLSWRSPIQVAPNLTVELFPAGHLPGAAAFLLTYTPSPSANPHPRSYTLLYTGDFLLSHSRLVEGFPLEELRGLAPDVLILEGSFGTARHGHRRQQENQLAQRIAQALREGISVILPVPVLGLGQELLMLLRSHHYFTGKDLDIWVEEAIAQGCDAYLEILPQLPLNVRNFAQHQPLFWDQRIRPRVQRLALLPEIHLGIAACIVLTDQQVDVSAYCQAQTSPWLVLSPQESEGTEQIKQKCADQIAAGQLRIETYLLAEHSDGLGTTQLIHNLRPQHVVFVHGNPLYLADLTGLDELSNRYHLHCPAAGTRVELPIADRPIQPSPTESSNRYEGEVAELGSIITLTLPRELTLDPRWQTFADTGLITGIWQGEELVLRGVTAQELLLDRTVVTDLKCCANCQYCRGQRCWNPASSLFEFKVSPEGYCPAYEPPSP
jgi:Cft2 family RNA processing exonuclease